MGVRLASEPIKRAALVAGFDFVGMCPAVEPPHLRAYLEWLAKGMHAGMDYMGRTKAQRSSPQSLLEGAKSILAVGLNYAQDDSLSVEVGKVAKYAWGRDYHRVVRKKLKAVAGWAEAAYVGLRTRVCVDSAPILERDYAWLAGLGWYGKNTCLINTKRGSWFFIGLLLLSEEFESDKPAVGGCGTCRLCIEACPTGALVMEKGREIAVLDANRCISYLTIEHRGEFTREQEKMLNGWIFGCDVCQDVCPFNKPRANQPMRAARTKEKDFAPRRQNAAPDLDWLVRADGDGFSREYSGSALMRAGVEGMRRNAKAILGFRREHRARAKRRAGVGFETR